MFSSILFVVACFVSHLVSAKEETCIQCLNFYKTCAENDPSSFDQYLSKYSECLGGQVCMDECTMCVASAAVCIQKSSSISLDRCSSDYSNCLLDCQWQTKTLSQLNVCQGCKSDHSLCLNSSNNSVEACDQIQQACCRSDCAVGLSVISLWLIMFVNWLW